MICKNCGKEIADRSPFCTECGAPQVWEDAPSAPETPVPVPEETIVTEVTNELPATPAAPEAPVYAAPQPTYAAAPAYSAPVAAPTPPVAPAYHAPAAYAAPQPPAAKPVKEKKPGKGGKIALIVTVAVLALALIAGGIFGYLLYNRKTAEINSLETEKTSLSDQLEQAQSNYDAVVDDYDALSGKYDTLSADYDALSKDYENATGEYDALLERYGEVVAENDRMSPEYDFFTEYAVVCSEQNKYYHTHECEDWDRSAFWIYNIDLAKSKEYTPCPKCMAEAEEATP